MAFNAQPTDVEWVSVDGRVLEERGALVGVDAKAVSADANRAAQRVRKALTRYHPPPVAAHNPGMSGSP